MAKANVTYMGRKYTVDNVDGLSSREIVERAAQQHESESTSRALKGFGTSLAQGATFNNGKRAWGALKTAMKHWGDNYAIYGDPQKNAANAATTKQDYQDAKKEFEVENKDFAKNHPKWNVAGQVVGGIAPSMIPLGAAAKATTLGGNVIQGAKGGGIIGGLYRAGEGLNESEDLLSTEALKNAASGAWKGGLIGAGIGGVTAALGHLGGKMIDNLKYKGVKGRVNQSIENLGEVDPNVAVIRQDNPHAASEFQRSVLNSEDSAVKADALFDKLKGEQRDKLGDEIANKFGVRSAREHEGVIDVMAQNKVAPKYRALEESGLVDVGGKEAKAFQQMKSDIASKKSFLNGLEEQAKDPNFTQLLENSPKYNSAAREAMRQQIVAEEASLTSSGAQANIFHDPRIQKTISDLKRRSTRLSKLADNDPRLMIEVDKVLGEQRFNLNNRSGQLSPKDVIDKLEINELHDSYRNFLDSKLPAYADARQAHIDTKKVPMEAMGYGKKFSNLTTDDLKKALSMTANNPEAQHSLEVGIGDTLRNQLLNAKSDDVNVIGKLFNDNTLRKMDMFGIKPTEELIQDRNVLSNIGKALGNSKTAHALAQNAKRDFANILKFTIKGMVNKVINASNRETGEEAARIMYQVLTDPQKYAQYSRWARMPANREAALKFSKKMASLATKQGGHYGSMYVEERD
ncbi:hypothetical protein AGMMS49593_08330 [Endomicrobiia bacterium]|nr:hypothetical protein AGMMS49593_08330 [Endomicrobiia bacterium]